MLARLGTTGNAAALATVRAAFERNNPGYRLAFARDLRRLEAAAHERVVFVQRGQGEARLSSDGLASDGLSSERAAPVTSKAARPDRSPVSVGDLVLLRAGQSLTCDAALDVLVFRVPEPFGDDLPSFLRPDWHPGITDTPGGCATETGAYRRVVLTWSRRNGPFNYRALNAHRVRITDSFTHYHPVVGGFDEFYLVQMVRPGARLLTSTRTAEIVDESLRAGDIDGLFESWDLQVGDLVYLPRGTVHRGLGGVLAHVITTPGFVPGAEIGVDHHLAAINEKLGLRGDDALPLHAEGAKRVIRR